MTVAHRSVMKTPKAVANKKAVSVNFSKKERKLSFREVKCISVFITS